MATHNTNAQTSPAYFDRANPHALASIARASQTHEIVASKDIFDAQGVKLWAKHQPVSYALQQRLLERKLRQPMETCLAAVDGVTVMQLHDQLRIAIEADAQLAPVLQPWAGELLKQVSHLPLHAVAQLLLTTMRSDRPEAMQHAVFAMGLSGAMCLSRGWDTSAVRVVMLAGLLHDIGELYIDPQHFQRGGERGSERDRENTMDGNAYRHMIVHPRVSQVLLSSLTDYPATVASAVLEHHERLDGSGYPSRTQAAGLSEFGRMLAVVDATLGILRRCDNPWPRASFALRMVPNEFDASMVDFVATASQKASFEWAAGPKEDTARIAEQLRQIDAAIDQAAEQAQRLVLSPMTTPVTRDVARQAQHLLSQLRTGWNEIGLWDASSDSPRGHFELMVAANEFEFRLRGIRRQCLWPFSELSDDAKNQLAPLWERLDRVARPDAPA